MWLAFLQGLSFASAPLLSFGAFKVFVFSLALREGWRKALPLALTPLLGDGPVILLIWLLLRQLPPWSLYVLQIAGGLFYIYLAIGLLRQAGRSADAESLEHPPRRNFWQALTAIWITPQVYINWSVIGVPALIRYGEQSAVNAVTFLGGFYLLWISGLALQIVIFGRAGTLNARVTQVLIYLACVLLIGFAGYQLWIGVTGLL